jgi:TolB-like protein
MKHLTLFLLTLLSAYPCFAEGDENPMAYSSLTQSLVSGEFRLNKSDNASGNLNKLATFIAEQLTHNRDLVNLKESRVAVTSFVNLENLRETDKLGLSLSELLIHKLQLSGFKVVDFKTMGDIKVTPNGDYVFSRNPADLKNEYNIHYFLSGTLTKSQDGIVVNARLLDAKTSLVTSSAQAFISARDARRLMSEFVGVEQEWVVIDRAAIPVPNMVKLK